MKHFITIIMVLFITVPTVNAQNKALDKALKKEYKMKIKEYKKEG